MASFKDPRAASLTLTSVASTLALSAILSPAVTLARSAGRPTKAVASAHTLLQSRQLWATIDVCNARDQPDTIGVRGSMPGDGQAGQTMYMMFRLEYKDKATKRWVSPSYASAPAYVAVGAAKSVRQGGGSFQLTPTPGKPALTWRGVVTFQWRRGSTAVTSASRPTSADRISLAGADPAGFSAATCTIG
jgi:hypothetical protein